MGEIAKKKKIFIKSNGQKMRKIMIANVLKKGHKEEEA